MSTKRAQTVTHLEFDLIFCDFIQRLIDDNNGLLRRFGLSSINVVFIPAIKKKKKSKFIV